MGIGILRICCYSVKGRSTKNQNVNVSTEVVLLRAITKAVLNANINPKRELTLPGLKVINFEYSFRLKIKRNDWLLVDTCPQAANHCAFRV